MLTHEHVSSVSGTLMPSVGYHGHYTHYTLTHKLVYTHFKKQFGRSKCERHPKSSNRKRKPLDACSVWDYFYLKVCISTYTFNTYIHTYMDMNREYVESHKAI